MITGRLTTAPAESSIWEILEERARTDPDRMVYCYLDEGEFETERLTYGELGRRARAIAATLQQHCRPGDRALLIYSPGLEFITALFACFAAGVIAVPACPPRLELVADGTRPLELIAENCRPALILVGATAAPGLQRACAGSTLLAGLPCLRSDVVDEARGADYAPVTLKRDRPALLQYTSGSTGEPRGVILTHGNLLANEHVIQLALDHRTAERPGLGVCWLPFWHDMGLVGNVLQAIYVDGACYLMSPLIVLQRPVRWLEAISKYRAHTSGGPGFAFDLCVNRITPEQKASLDLSCWESAPVGAEPISYPIMERFAEAFASCGFRMEAFYPCYGLAEATLFATGGRKADLPVVRRFQNEELEFRSGGNGSHPDQADRLRPCASSQPEAPPEPIPPETIENAQAGDTALLVGCGQTWTDHELLIVDPNTHRVCPHGTIGEIWFRGPSVAAGYWNRPRETGETFDAHLADSGAGPFLRTGDLGLICDGELFVAGRLKDLIVIRGQNHYPQDIESTVCAVHDAFRINTTAAFSIPGDVGERLVVLQEIDRQTRRLDIDQLRREVRHAVAQRHQLQLADLVFLRNGTIPKTTSGKVRRHECRQRYLDGKLLLWKGRADA